MENEELDTNEQLWENQLQHIFPMMLQQLFKELWSHSSDKSNKSGRKPYHE